MKAVSKPGAMRNDGNGGISGNTVPLVTIQCVLLANYTCYFTLQ